MAELNRIYHESKAIEISEGKYITRRIEIFQAGGADLPFDTPDLIHLTEIQKGVEDDTDEQWMMFHSHRVPSRAIRHGITVFDEYCARITAEVQ